MLCNLCGKTMKMGNNIYTCTCGFVIKNNNPTLVEMAGNLASSLVKHITTGMVMVSKEIKKERLNICSSCEFYNKTNETNPSCNKCGCYLLSKTGWASEKCPIDKWHEIKTGETGKPCGCKDDQQT